MATSYVSRRPYADPDGAGVGLGLVLLSAFAFAGPGLGASGAFTRLAAATVAAGWPDYAYANRLFSRYLIVEGG